ncbi:hypothetical protein PMAYCL1PPCAC_03850, partial [Pristionchus mayeri]
YRLTPSAIQIIAFNFVPVSLSAYFLDLREDEMPALLKSDALRVDSEEDVFSALDRWMSHDDARR